MENLFNLSDLNVEEYDIRSQYYSLFTNGDIDSARDLIKENEQLQDKVLNAENLNKLVEHIISLENKYYDNVELVLLNHINTYNISIDNLIFLDEYDSSKTYYENNFVLYNSELYFHFNKDATTDVSPTNKTYWLYLGLKGEDGYKDLGVNYIGSYSSTREYNKYDMVVYSNNLYVAKKSVPMNNIPSTTSEYWSRQVKVSNQGIYVSKEEPQGLEDGNIWIEIM